MIEIPINIINIEGDGFHIVTDGLVNGKSARFVVDTGASRTVFDKDRILNYINNPEWQEGDSNEYFYIPVDFHGYIIGLIKKDKYYQIGYHIGESPYRKLGYENNKKYFGQTSMGIEEDGVIYKIAELVRKEETITEKKAVTKEEEKNYMEKGGLQTRLVKANDLSALSVRVWKWGA